MNTSLIVQISGNTWERLDIFEDIPITLTIQQSDLLNLTNRRVPYSKTFEIPDTSQNAIIFEHYFEVNGIDFNPLNKIDCVVQYRGTDIFTGILRLNAVIETASERLYEVFILGEVADWFNGFKDLDLQDLDYTDLVHDLTYSAVTKSWECVNDGASGLFDGQIIYPMINYGLRYSGTTTGSTPSFSMDFGQPRSFDKTAFPMAPNDFKPAIQIKSVLDRIFAISNEYTIRSEFFDSEYFTSIYMDTFQNAEVGTSISSAITNQNIFKAQFPFVEYQYSKDTLHNIPLFDNYPGGYDPLNNYRNFFFQPTGFGVFRAPYAGTYSFNFRFNLQFLNPIRFAAIPAARIAVVVKVANSINVAQGTTVYQSPDILLNQAFFNDLPVNLFFNIPLVAGQYLQVFILDLVAQVTLGFYSGSDYAIKPFSQGGVVDPLILFELFSAPVLITPTIDMTIGIPNLKCLDFMKSLITMFNLVVVQDEIAKVIRIEPYNWYYNNPERLERDWTNILDQNSPKRIEPLSFELSKDVIWTYNGSEFEFLPKVFRDRFNYEFGRKKFETTNELFSGEQTYEVAFNSCPTSGVTGNDYFIIPQYFYLNNGLQTPYATQPHLFFWTGNRYVDAYGASGTIFPGDYKSWYLLSGSTPVEWVTYPCVNHLSTLESQFPQIISDLNFESTFDFFGNSWTQTQQFTPFTVYNSFWATYVDNLYSPESRRLTGRFFFKPLDVYETSLKDRIWIKDAWYTIEKITDANLVNKTLTEIALIKEPSPYYKIDPPSPIYAIAPNQPYPPVEPTFLSGVFYSTDADDVCNGTAPIETILSFGTGTLQNLRKVYYDTGTAFALVPMGTYIRQTTSSDTFVVADTYGRILEYDC